jgi:hydroxymethylglutaryl-CoA lyase
MSIKQNFTIVECPRDAMQGLHQFIPTKNKIKYLQRLLDVGFHTIDAGSFVSPKAIPQMADTKEVLDGLDLSATKSKLLCIVANERGAREAADAAQVSYLGYPFSISETFQKRNTNKSIAQSLELVDIILDVCGKQQKELVLYISMGFGNPYQEEWSPELLVDWAGKLIEKGVGIISLSDTVGVAKPDDIRQAFSHLNASFPEVVFGAHLHTPYNDWRSRVEAAYQGGCRRFDGAIQGLGGCPMAKDDLVGNMPTEKLISFAEEQKQNHGLNMLAFESAYNIASQIMF